MPGFDPRTYRMQDALHALVSAPNSHIHTEHGSIEGHPSWRMTQTAWAILVGYHVEATNAMCDRGNR